jgi:hypothetical protein
MLEEGSSGAVDVSRTKEGPPPPNSAARAASSSGEGSEDGLRGRWMRKLLEFWSGAMTWCAAAGARVWEASNSVTNRGAGAGAERGSASSPAVVEREEGLGGLDLEAEMEKDSFFSFSMAAEEVRGRFEPGMLVEP